MKQKGIILLIFALGCAACNAGWESHEKELIDGAHPLMRVLTIDNDADELVLRSISSDLSLQMIDSETYSHLEKALVATVTSPEQDGVGIAGPQVGILRRVIAVQRFDKEGEPFIVYPNIRITEMRGDKVPGREGCLSVPGEYGIVDRYQDIDISYTSPKTLQDTTETVHGFTAVIFQHEVDHLSGILYTDLRK